MQWISVQDSLPEEGKYIIVFGIIEFEDEPGIHIARRFMVEVHDINNNVKIEEEYWGSGMAYDIEVTHWMYLPEEPYKD